MAMLSPSAPVQATDRWGGPGMEVPQNEWFIYNGKSYQNGWFRGNLNIRKPLKWMIWGYPYFRTPPYWPAFQRFNPSVWIRQQIPAVPLGVTTINSSATDLNRRVCWGHALMKPSSDWNPPSISITITSILIPIIVVVIIILFDDVFNSDPPSPPCTMMVGALVTLEKAALDVLVSGHELMDHWEPAKTHLFFSIKLATKSMTLLFFNPEKLSQLVQPHRNLGSDRWCLVRLFAAAFQGVGMRIFLEESAGWPQTRPLRVPQRDPSPKTTSSESLTGDASYLSRDDPSGNTQFSVIEEHPKMFLRFQIWYSAPKKRLGCPFGELL